MKLLKEMAWKLPVGLIWNIAAGFPFKHLSFWKGLIAWFIFYIALDLIRWGLKRQKEPTDMSQYRQHVYVFDTNDDSHLITELWTCNVPDIEERMTIWIDGEFKHYTLKHRIYGANADEKVGVWNLYVDEYHPEDVMTEADSEELCRQINEMNEKQL